MNILSIGNFGHGWDGSICDEQHILDGLSSFGHEVAGMDRERTKTYSINQTKLWLPQGVEDYDFILISQWDGYDVDLIEKLRVRHSCPIVYWAFDYQADGQEWHERLVTQADLYLSKRIADSKYPNWQWLAQDFAPAFLDKWDAVIDDKHYDPLDGHKIVPPKDIDVLFTGTYLDWATERNTILKAVDEKYYLTIHSVNPEAWKAAGFKNVYGPVMDDQLPQLIARAKVNISIDHTIEAGYWSDRNAQIMCCGGFVLFRHVPLSTAIFRSNIGYFYDVESCLTSLDYWLEADEDRENLAGFGHDFAQQNLTVKERVSDLLNIVQGLL